MLFSDAQIDVILIFKETTMSLKDRIEVETEVFEYQAAAEVLPSGPYCSIPQDYFDRLLCLRTRANPDRRLLTIKSFDGRSILSVLI